MADNPWMKFYPRDWRGDQALRSVSIAARGFWMECLCIMHEATPYGHLMLNGNPVEGDTLARMAGVSVDEVHHLMVELRQAGVLSVTRKGVVFSRRMTKDHARAQKGKAAAKKRWKQHESDTPQAPDTKQKSGAPNRPPNRPPTTQKPEARSQKKKEEAIASSKKNRGSRLSQDWFLPRDWGEWALERGLSEPAIRRESERFANYWWGMPDQRGVKLDWQATWRNWVLRALDNIAPGATTARHATPTPITDPELREREREIRARHVALADRDDDEAYGLRRELAAELSELKRAAGQGQ